MPIDDQMYEFCTPWCCRIYFKTVTDSAFIRRYDLLAKQYYIALIHQPRKHLATRQQRQLINTVTVMMNILNLQYNMLPLTNITGAIGREQFESLYIKTK